MKVNYVEIYERHTPRRKLDESARNMEHFPDINVSVLLQPNTIVVIRIINWEDFKSK